MNVLAWLCLLAAALYAVHRFWRGYPPPAPAFRHLARHEIAFVEAASNAIFPPGGAIAPSGRDAKIPAYVDAYVASVPARTRLLMRMLFFLVEHVTFFVPAPGPGGHARFSSLSTEQQVAVLDAWGRSRFQARRLVFTSLRAILTLGYFAHPPVLRALSLAPFDVESPVVEADLLYPRVGQRTAAIGLTRAALCPPPANAVPIDLHGALHPAYRDGAA